MQSERQIKSKKSKTNKIKVEIMQYIICKRESRLLVGIADMFSKYLMNFGRFDFNGKIIA